MPKLIKKKTSKAVIKTIQARPADEKTESGSAFPIVGIGASAGGLEALEHFLSRVLAKSEREHIIVVLKTTGWKVNGKNGAAEILGLNPKTLESKVQKLGIVRNKNNTGV